MTFRNLSKFSSINKQNEEVIIVVENEIFAGNDIREDITHIAKNIFNKLDIKGFKSKLKQG